MWAHPHLHEIPADALLLRGTQALLPPLWSLKWEVIFSLLLPLAVYVAARTPRRGAVQVVVLLAITCFGTETSGGRGYFLYLPMFGVGAVMARTAIVASCGLEAGSCRWLGFPDRRGDPHERRLDPPCCNRGRHEGIKVAGAALLVFLCAYWNPFRRVAEHPSLSGWASARSASTWCTSRSW